MLQNILGNLGNGPAAALASSASSVKESMISQYSLLSKQLEQQITTYETNWCTPGKFTPGKRGGRRSAEVGREGWARRGTLGFQGLQAQLHWVAASRAHSLAGTLPCRLQEARHLRWPQHGPDLRLRLLLLQRHQGK
jgi:hypothetical protein